MSPDALLTACILAGMLAVLALGRFPPAGVVLGAVGVLLFTGVIDERMAFAGFSNSAPLTVAALYVLADAAQRTGILSALVARVLGDGRDRWALARLALPTAAASAFFNNTPLVATLLPDVLAWCRRQNLSPSKFLLPLSFATILGGTVTVLGTSTNLVVSGLLEESGAEPFGLFEVTKIGLPAALAGMAVLIFICPRLLPDRRVGAADRVDDEAKSFTMMMKVLPGGAVDGSQVEAAGLRHLDGVYLVGIEREGSIIAPVEPTETLRGGDHLTFVGRLDQVLDLQRSRGLRSAEEKHVQSLSGVRHRLYEVVVGQSSRLMGQTLADVDFRSYYGAAVLAIHRAGHRIDAKLGQVELRHGDTLVLLAGQDFRERWGPGRDFLVIAPLDAPPPAATNKAPLVALALAGFVGLSAFQVTSTLQGALLAAAFVIATRVVTFNQARDAIDLDVVVLIAAALGVGAAVQVSGLAEWVASNMVNAFGGLGTFGIVLGILIATTLLTEVVTNNAAAAVLFPIALSIAGSAGIEPRQMAIGLAVMASSSYLTPVGYQTNTMVYGPGGYRFSDYFRVGLPINIVVTLVTAVMIVSQ